LRRARVSRGLGVRRRRSSSTRSRRRVKGSGTPFRAQHHRPGRDLGGRAPGSASRLGPRAGAPQWAQTSAWLRRAPRAISQLASTVGRLDDGDPASVKAPQPAAASRLSHARGSSGGQAPSAACRAAGVHNSRRPGGSVARAPISRCGPEHQGVTLGPARRADRSVGTMRCAWRCARRPFRPRRPATRPVHTRRRAPRSTGPARIPRCRGRAPGLRPR
jgi:hypothetical protein